jgi:hypothetical protein
MIQRLVCQVVRAEDPVRAALARLSEYDSAECRLVVAAAETQLMQVLDRLGGAVEVAGDYQYRVWLFAPDL